MKEKNTICKNCERYAPSRQFCSKCYPFILKIKKIGKGELPNNLDRYLSTHGKEDLDKMKNECIRQLKHRLGIIKDSYVLKDKVGEHDLELRINSTLKSLGYKTLGKKNDELRSHLGEKERAYVYQLFSEIQLLRPFKYDYFKILS